MARPNHRTTRAVHSLLEEERVAVSTWYLRHAAYAFAPRSWPRHAAAALCAVVISAVLVGTQYLALLGDRVRALLVELRDR